MALNSLALARVYQMSKATDTLLTERHMSVLEYTWRFYRTHSIGPLYQNIYRYTGVSKKELARIFPNGLSSVFAWIGIPIQGKESGCKAMVALEVENLREVYFDYNATTPLRQEVAIAMVNFLKNPRSYGNASSAYDIGSIAFDEIDQARHRIAKCLGATSREVFFTGSGTEANNLAIKGLFEHLPDGPGHFVTSCIEHSSVLQVARFLESKGHEITYLPVQQDGTLCLNDVKAAIRPDTVAVSIMAANNEIGTTFPLSGIGRICRERGVIFVVDAIQAFGKIVIRPKELGISVLTMSGHKIGAPKGVGALFVDESIEITPQMHGGSQESGLRPGTENVLGIYAMGLAAKLAFDDIDEQTDHLLGLRNYFLKNLALVEPNAFVNGTLEQRLPSNLSIGFPDIDSGSMLLSLNQIGIYVSAGSACSAGSDKNSHVLDAIGVDASKYGTVRFSFGRATTREDIDYLFEHLPAVLEGIRQ